MVAIWLTLPTLKFTANNIKENVKFTTDYLEDNIKIVDDIMERYRDGKIPIEKKFELSYTVSSHEVFPLIDKCLDIALQNGVKDLVLRGHGFTSYPLPIFTILAAKSLRELVLRNCNFTGVSLSSVVPNCDSLRKLSLYFVRLDENMLQILLNSCPLIVAFILEYCWGLEKIELVNLHKIKSVSISKCRKQRVKIEAPTLEHFFLFSFTEEYNMLDTIDAPNLISLKCGGAKIPETFTDANLQWSCHPRIVLLSSNSKMISCFVDRLMYMKSSSYSTSHGSKDLHSQLKEVKAYIFDGETWSWRLLKLKKRKAAPWKDRN